MKEIKAKLLCCGIPPFNLPVSVLRVPREAHPQHLGSGGHRQLLQQTTWSGPWVTGWARHLLCAWLTEEHGSRTARIAALGDETFQTGVLRQWQLTLYGSVWSPVDIRDRQR